LRTIATIAIVIAHEKNTNAHGPDARKIRELNDYSSERCVKEYRNLAWWRQLLGLGISPQQCVSNEMTDCGRLMTQPIVPPLRKGFDFIVPGRSHVTAQQLVSFITTSTEIAQNPYQP